jgi:hypothetical protein
MERIQFVPSVDEIMEVALPHLEEAEDDKGKFQRVVPESYKYVTTDFTADPSTFGVMPLDVKRNLVAVVGKESHNEKAILFGFLG